MLAKAFVVAMAADIARSDYAKPTLIRSRSREWLIACRWGPDGEYLSIATAGAILGPRGAAAPDAIAPIHSLFGVLVSESEKEAASTFLLVRQLPIPIELAGTFFPADGYALLQQRETISLDLQNPLFAQLRLAGWQGGPQGHSRPGAVLAGGHGMAHRGQALQLDRRVHFQIGAARKTRRSRQRLSPISVPLKCRAASRGTV